MPEISSNALTSTAPGCTSKLAVANTRHHSRAESHRDDEPDGETERPFGEEERGAPNFTNPTAGIEFELSAQNLRTENEQIITRRRNNEKEPPQRFRRNAKLNDRRKKWRKEKQNNKKNKIKENEDR